MLFQIQDQCRGRQVRRCGLYDCVAHTLHRLFLVRRDGWAEPRKSIAEEPAVLTLYVAEEASLSRISCSQGRLIPRR